LGLEEACAGTGLKVQCGHLKVSLGPGQHGDPLPPNTLPKAEACQAARHGFEGRIEPSNLTTKAGGLDKEQSLIDFETRRHLTGQPCDDPSMQRLEDKMIDDPLSAAMKGSVAGPLNRFNTPVEENEHAALGETLSTEESNRRGLHQAVDASG
tara:strand:- start:344 stop:802 length:459 start_codon:yes stop_codon:yes gene_type:complete